jgi:hypothetical protein
MELMYAADVRSAPGVTRAAAPAGVSAGQRLDREVARGGVEPPTFRFSVGRSYQLSYLAV